MSAKWDAEKQAAYLAHVKANPATKNWDDAKWAAFGTELNSKVGPSVGGMALDAGKAVGKTVLKGLDYIDGIGRTAANTVQTLNQGAETPKNAPWFVDPSESELPPVKLNPEQRTGTVADWKQALKGNAPLNSEYLERQGMPAGAARTGLGLGLDFVQGPTTYVGAGIARQGVKGVKAISDLMKRGGQLGAKAAPVVEALGKGAAHVVGGDVLGAAMESGGRGLYRSAFTNIDHAARRANKKGTNPVSDLFLENNMRGTARQVANDSVDWGQRIGNQRETLMSEAQYLVDKAEDARRTVKAPFDATEVAKSANVGVDLSPDINKAMQPAFNYAETLASKPGTAKGANAAKDYVSHYAHFDAKPTLAEVSSWKSQLYNTIGPRGWDTLMKTPEGKNLQKIMARGLADEVVEVANKASSHAGISRRIGDEIAAKNDTWGKILTTAKALDNEAIKGERKHWLTSVDPMVAALGFATGAGPAGGLATMAAKKGADLQKTMWLKTQLGSRMYNGSKNEELLQLLKRIGVNATKGMVADE